MGRYVHNETDAWCLTSDEPLSFFSACEDEHVYDRILPGRLGMYVYPRDVRFHMKDRAKTTHMDFDAVVRAERVSHVERTVNVGHHLSVIEDRNVCDTFVPNEEEGDAESEDDEEDDGEEDEDEEDEVEPHEAGMEECIESDDDDAPEVN